MSINDHLEKMKKLYSYVLDFIDKDEDLEENFENLKKKINEEKISQDPEELRLLLRVLVKISNNHHRTAFFFPKIEQIIKIFRQEIHEHYENSDIFKIFKSNKRILLFLIEEKMMNVDKFVFLQIMSNKYKLAKYPQYFSPEIRPFIEEQINKKEISSKLAQEICFDIPMDFKEKRLKGENDNILSEIIRNDSLDKFILHINSEDYFANNCIDSSIFETNSLLMNETPTLLEYAAFFGSINIFNYLINNKFLAKTSPLLWCYAAHSNNIEIIKLLQQRNDFFPYKELILESIKCHHNSIVNILFQQCKEKLKQRINFDIESIIDDQIRSFIFRYCNFQYLFEVKNDDLFIYACEYNYYNLVNLFLQSEENVKNKNAILIIFFMISTVSILIRTQFI